METLNKQTSSDRPPQKIAVAISGGGRSLQNLIALQKGRAYQVAAVISSSLDCPGLTLARELGLPIHICSHHNEVSIQTQLSLKEWLCEHEISWIALAGYLKPFPIIPGFQERIINIHPALLPAYGGRGMYGMHVHRAVHKNQEPYSGATIHFVNEHYDEGSIIAQIKIKLTPSTSPEAIAAQVFSAECKLYPEVLDLLCQGLLPATNGTTFQLEG